jgi:WD40 repeat protein
MVTSLAVAPGDELLLSGGEDGTVHCWEVNAGRPAAVLNWKIGQVHAVAVSPDGMLAAAGGGKGLVVWDLGDLG